MIDAWALPVTTIVSQTAENDTAGDDTAGDEKTPTAKRLKRRLGKRSGKVSETTAVEETTEASAEVSEKEPAPVDVSITDTGSNSPAINLIGTLAPGSLAVTNSAKAFTLSGTGSLSGTTGLVKSGTATLTLATANTYSGPTAIDAGVVTLQHATALGTATGGTTVANNARLELEGNITVTGESLSLAGTGGSSFFNGAINSKSGINTWTGPTTISAGALTLGANQALPATAVSIGSATLAGAAGTNKLILQGNDTTTTWAAMPWLDSVRSVGRMP